MTCPAFIWSCVAYGMMHISLFKATDLDILKFLWIKALWFLASAGKPDDQWGHSAQQHHLLMAGLLHRGGPETKCDILF